jgi:protein O-GlcNAc transferase
VKIKSRPSPGETARAVRAAINMCHAREWPKAIRLLRDLIAYEPQHFDALHLLGSALVQSGRAKDGAEALEQAARVKPNAPALWINLGSARQVVGEFEAAIAAYKRAVELQPDNPDANHRLCMALADFDRPEEAVPIAKSFTARKPGSSESWTTLGLIELRLGLDSDAVESLGKALALRDTNNLALRSLALHHVSRGRYEAAVPLLDKAVTRMPDDMDLLHALATSRRFLCEWEGIEVIEARIIDAVRAGTATILPLGLLNIADDAALQLANARRYMAGWSQNAKQWDGGAYTHERIRVAYFSADFRDHPVSHLIRDVIKHHDRCRFEIIGISYGPDDASGIRAELAASFDRFIDLPGATPVALADAIREAEIDIVIDLSGSTEAGRPETLALRPAPVQISYLGFAGTTGARFVDYLIADRVVVPAEAAVHYAEQIVALPQCFMPSSAWRQLPAPSRIALGLPESGFVFCALNAVNKVTPSVFRVWTNLLTAVPGSVLWLRAPSARAADNLRTIAVRRGINPNRLVFAGYVPSRDEHLARYRSADLFLDTTPYNAHTTACEALSAGLPVLTVLGESFASRVAASLVKAVGLDDLVTNSLNAYEARALDLTRDPGRLATLRAGLGQGRAGSVLFDPQRLAHNLEQAFLEMHLRAVRGASPQPIELPKAS